VAKGQKILRKVTGKSGQSGSLFVKGEGSIFDLPEKHPKTL